MTEPRAALDAYAMGHEPGAIGCRGFNRRDHAPAAFAALRAVLDLHKPEPLRAGVRPHDHGAGRCCFWHLGAPIREYRGKPQPGSPETDMHDHINPEPWCTSCDVDDDLVRWPCPTVRAITTALEAK